MGSFKQTTGLIHYDLNSNTISHHPNSDEDVFSGILEIYLHHATNIRNICIYQNQDVYAKFSLTYNPDEILTTRIVTGGGKNPIFDENLRLKITQLDAVLKCEIWMLSRARNYMEDQLLGFVLVPISQIAGKGKITEDYSLSSTDLFHSPAGAVKLSLSLITPLPLNPSNSSSETSAHSSISTEIVLLDRKVTEVIPSDPVEYSRIEFPDISVVRENQQMVSEYFNLARHGSGSRPGSGQIASFLHLGAPCEDYEMAVANSSDELQGGSTSPNESIQNSGFLSSTATSLSDDRNSGESIQKKTVLGSELLNSVNSCVTKEAENDGSGCPDTPTSKKGIREAIDEKDSNFASKEKEVINKEGNNTSCVKFGQLFGGPLGNMNINLEAEQSAMQQQIVDMYMRSMQQFTESLAKMKLPMDLDKPEREDSGVVIQNPENKVELEKKNKKDGSRVFYGSRAFF